MLMEVESADPGPVFVHIGLPKTGTTYLQHCFAASQPRLHDEGWLYPVEPPYKAHWLAALDLEQEGKFAGEVFAEAGAWKRLADQITQWGGRALVSHEMLAGCGPEKAKKVVQDFSPHPVEILITVRDLSRVVPAAWQEDIKNGSRESWAGFLDGVRQGPAGRHPFWRLQDLDRILSCWVEAVGADRVHVITVPRRNSEETLLDRVLRALGMGSDVLEVASSADNHSIGVVEAAVVQKINELLKRRTLDFHTYHRLVKHRLVPNVLARRPEMHKLSLVPDHSEWVEDLTRRHVNAIERSGCDVVGDVCDLKPLGFSSLDIDPDAVPADQVDQAFAQLVVDLTRISAKKDRRLRADARDLARTRADLRRTQEELEEAKQQFSEVRGELAALRRAAEEESSARAELSAGQFIKHSLVELADHSRAAAFGLRLWRLVRRNQAPSVPGQ